MASNEGKQEKGDSDGGKKELNHCEIDGLICPICFDTLTSSGEHRICCLPCGHIYGLLCINKWLEEGPNSGKCPQCKGLCTLKDVRVLYAADEMLHKAEVSCVDTFDKLSHLETQMTHLESMVAHVKSRIDTMASTIREVRSACVEF